MMLILHEQDDCWMLLLLLLVRIMMMVMIMMIWEWHDDVMMLVVMMLWWWWWQRRWWSCWRWYGPVWSAGMHDVIWYMTWYLRYGTARYGTKTYHYDMIFHNMICDIGWYALIYYSVTWYGTAGTDACWFVCLCCHSVRTQTGPNRYLTYLLLIS